jgi:hypothetical protein
MTKTFTAVDQYCFAMPALTVIMPFGTNTGGLVVWNFEFGSLGFV